MSTLRVARHTPRDSRGGEASQRGGEFVRAHRRDQRVEARLHAAAENKRALELEVEAGGLDQPPRHHPHRLRAVRHQRRRRQLHRVLALVVASVLVAEELDDLDAALRLDAAHAVLEVRKDFHPRRQVLRRVLGAQQVPLVLADGIAREGLVQRAEGVLRGPVAAPGSSARYHGDPIARREVLARRVDRVQAGVARADDADVARALHRRSPTLLASHPLRLDCR